MIPITNVTFSNLLPQYMVSYELRTEMHMQSFPTKEQILFFSITFVHLSEREWPLTARGITSFRKPEEQ
jgi:hypothetical protein